MLELTTYANAAAETLKKILRHPRGKGLWKTAGAGLAGLLLSAASLAHQATPLALGLLCASPPGAYAAAIALGGCMGYLIFWNETQGVAWMAAGLLAVALAGDKPALKQQKLLLPAISALIISGCGLLFLLLRRDDASLSVFLLRVLMSSASTAVYRQWRSEPTGPAGWLAAGLGTLALAQIAPVPLVNLGFLAAGLAAGRCAFPTVVMVGLGLDLAQVTKLPMTGILCLSFCLRLIPRPPKWLSLAAPAISFFTVSMICSRWDLAPLPGLLVGCLAGQYLPGNLLSNKKLQRRGPTGLAQVRLEKAAVTLQKMEHTLVRTPDAEPDLHALLRQVADNACDTCPERRACKARHLVPALSPDILERPGLQTIDLPPGCRKNGRLLTELRRGQEQLRRMKGDRSRQNSYRSALQDQYSFLSEYLQGLSDDLGATEPLRPSRFRPEIGIRSQSLEEVSGDRCVYFEGVGNLGYLLLCDGMGTGAGAAGESQNAIDLIRQYLESGFSASHALRCFNSLCALTGTAGCATIDLLEMDLSTGKSSLYKWGAGPSYLSVGGQLRKIGTAGAPPGLSQQARESVDRLSLSGGEALIMLSDGAGAEGLSRAQWTAPDMPPGELAAWILEQGVRQRDDATVAVVCLRPIGLATQ